mgnify:CR=1 FL=1
MPVDGPYDIRLFVVSERLAQRLGYVRAGMAPSTGAVAGVASKVFWVFVRIDISWVWSTVSTCWSADTGIGRITLVTWDVTLEPLASSAIDDGTMNSRSRASVSNSGPVSAGWVERPDAGCCGVSPSWCNRFYINENISAFGSCAAAVGLGSIDPNPVRSVASRGPAWAEVCAVGLSPSRPRSGMTPCSIRI